MVCGFTGHRTLLGDLDYALLDRVILNLIKNGYNRFLCGMAKGFDMLAAESVIKFKEQYDLHLAACIPCLNQSDYFGNADRQRYNKILDCCDEKIFISETYYSGCMHVRDRYITDNCDVLVCYLRKNSGGTFYTVNCARNLNKKIIEI